MTMTSRLQLRSAAATALLALCGMFAVATQSMAMSEGSPVTVADGTDEPKPQDTHWG
ncbi:hypothetical protein ACFU76_36455 [Streptomyces sp. NPDC057539]|uniref:hypothetical protein n=1 Tax=Streptomyces sp. NPDC057539 TaxID=3346159 RepID=UPI0036A81088